MGVYLLIQQYMCTHMYRSLGVDTLGREEYTAYAKWRASQPFLFLLSLLGLWQSISVSILPFLLRYHQCPNRGRGCHNTKLTTEVSSDLFILTSLQVADFACIFACFSFVFIVTSLRLLASDEIVISRLIQRHSSFLVYTWGTREIVYPACVFDVVLPYVGHPVFSLRLAFSFCFD